MIYGNEMIEDEESRRNENGDGFVDVRDEIMNVMMNVMMMNE